MTLLVGILCRDGVVVAADSAVTTGVYRQSGQKLSVIEGQAVIGAAGSVETSHRVISHLCNEWKVGGRFNGATPHELIAGVRARMVPVVQDEIRLTAQLPTLSGDQSQIQSSLGMQFLVTVCKDDVPILGAINLSAPLPQPCTIATPDQPIVTRGSGWLLAAPFLLFLRRMFWPNRLPSVDEGMVAATWAMVHTIETNPGGVAEPIKLAVLQRNAAAEWHARHLDDSEIDGYRDMVDRLEQRVASINPREERQEPARPAPPPQPPVATFS